MTINSSIIEQISNQPTQEIFNNSLGALAWSLLSEPSVKNLRFFEYLCYQHPQLKQELLSYLQQNDLDSDYVCTTLLNNYKIKNKDFSEDEVIYSLYLFYRETQLPINTIFLIESQSCRYQLNLKLLNLNFDLVDDFEKNKKTIYISSRNKNKVLSWIDLFLQDPKFLNYYKKNKLYFFSLFVSDDYYSDYQTSQILKKVETGEITNLIEVILPSFYNYRSFTDQLKQIDQLFSISLKTDNLSNLNFQQDNFLHILFKKIFENLASDGNFFNYHSSSNLATHPFFAFIESLDKKYYYLLLEKNNLATPLEDYFEYLDQLTKYKQVKNNPEKLKFIVDFKCD